MHTIVNIPIIKPKKRITITGILNNILTPGLPAVFLYNGNIIRTAAVTTILEASQDYIRFETNDTVYTLSYRQSALSKSKTS